MCSVLVSNFNIEKNIFLKALSLSDHRGPDVPGNYSKIKDWQLGHNLLRVVTHDNTVQPLRSHSGKHIIVWNGEIYNYKELAKRFEIQLRTLSDTELIVELFEKLGAEMLQYFNGMFSIFIQNVETNQFFVARDRLGVKPLFYYNNNNLWSFSSEVAALLELHQCYEIDTHALKQYQKLRGFLGERTLYKEIKSFPSGHYMIDGKFKKWWDLSLESKFSQTSVEDLLTDSIEIRKSAAVNVGCFLSGGLDSSILATLGNIQFLWTVGMPENNEFKWAQIVADQQNIKLNQICVSNEIFLQTAKNMISKRKEPLSVPNEVLIFLLCKEAKNANTVLLSGEGADELFAGYYRIFNWAANQKTFDIVQFDQLYSYSKGNDLELLEEVLTPFSQYENLFQKVSAFFIKVHLEGLCRRLDYASMLAGVEVRSPFLDFRLIEAFWARGADFKMNGTKGKIPLIDLAKKILPEEIINRNKVGFPIDLDSIFMNYTNNGKLKTGYDKWFHFNLNCLGVTS